MLLRKTYLDKIRPFIDTKIIKVLTGMRRSGKSIILSQIQDELLAKGVSEKAILSFNFEARAFAHLCEADALHDEILRQAQDAQARVYIFLDEIQRVANWERAVNSLQVSLDCDIFITGSNSELLSGDLATFLTGRYVEIMVYPFSFKEFLAIRQTEGPSPDLREEFKQYLILGGMPPILDSGLELPQAQMFLKSLYDSFILQDIVKRNNIRDVELLERIMTYVMDNVGQILSANNVSKSLKSEGRAAAADTILAYLRYAERAFYLHKAERYDLRGKQILASGEKYYMSDHGFRQAILGSNERDIQAVLENIVFMDLLRRGWTVQVGAAGGKEIDFVCSKGNDKLYIQVCYLLAGEETIKRGFGPLLDLPDHFPKYVLSLDEFDLSREGVQHLNIRDFLLAP